MDTDPGSCLYRFAHGNDLGLTLPAARSAPTSAGAYCITRNLPLETQLATQCKRRGTGETPLRSLGAEGPSRYAAGGGRRPRNRTPEPVTLKRAPSPKHRMFLKFPPAFCAGLCFALRGEQRRIYPLRGGREERCHMRTSPRPWWSEPGVTRKRLVGEVWFDETDPPPPAPAPRKSPSMWGDLGSAGGREGGDRSL